MSGQVPKVNLLQGKPAAQMTAVSAGKTLPQGATIVKLVTTQASGECLSVCLSVGLSVCLPQRH